MRRLKYSNPLGKGYVLLPQNKYCVMFNKPLASEALYLVCKEKPLSSASGYQFCRTMITDGLAYT